MQKTYPAVVFVASHGRKLALILGGLIACLSILSCVFTGSLSMLAIGLAISLACWAFIRTASEVVEVVADTLIPR